jgi:hypothetical protein
MANFTQHYQVEETIRHAAWKSAARDPDVSKRLASFKGPVHRRRGDVHGLNEVTDARQPLSQNADRASWFECPPESPSL